MSQLSYDDEDYYFQISDELESDKEFVLIIYDIVDNRKRVNLPNFCPVMENVFRSQLLRQC